MFLEVETLKLDELGLKLQRHMNFDFFVAWPICSGQARNLNLRDFALLVVSTSLKILQLFLC